MANAELTLGQRKTFTGGIVHPVFNQTEKTGTTDHSIGIYKDAIFAGPIRIFDGGKNLHPGKIETGNPPKPKLWVKLLN